MTMADLESKVASQTNKKEEERKKWPARFLPHSLSQHLGPSCELFTACLFILLEEPLLKAPGPLHGGGGMTVEPMEISTLRDCCIVAVWSIVLDNNTNNHNNLGFLQLAEGGLSASTWVWPSWLRFLRCEGLRRSLALSGPPFPCLQGGNGGMVSAGGGKQERVPRRARPLLSRSPKPGSPKSTTLRASPAVVGKLRGLGGGDNACCVLASVVRALCTTTHFILTTPRACILSDEDTQE